MRLYERSCFVSVRNCLLLVIFCACFGCAAAQIALEKKNLKVETQMSDTIFLDVETQIERTVFVDVRNTSDKEIDVKSLLVSKLQAKGYTVTNTPAEAFYILQANILYVGKADPSALRESVYGGYGGVLAGSMGGAVIGGVTHGLGGAAYGAGIGALAGGVGELVAGSLVKDVTYTIVTDLMISERSVDKVEQIVQSGLLQGKGSKIEQTSKSTVDRKRYQTRIASSANKVNLNFEEALSPMFEGLARSISGIF
ncbi:Lipoprotein YlpA precursor [Candidatus Brocadiaceae bacterium B188]|nr:complement resistance protein TraT [Candidatus Brocadia sapporoensis]QQR65676.1 MAG: complement resistance protein TraT [Candidatus Brocadia sp.]RZV59823.1 MAG: conjugal transfer protein TraT [Candidatus Brocadia sp. BROELEC01]TWU49988.1 Lipoprotein YlpA precursor [Candidatus Brocadiaceae bacterium B188]